MWPFEKKETTLDEAIERLDVEIGNTEPDADIYDKLIVRRERLTKIRDNENRRRVSPDTVAIVAGNLLGILIIVGYERAHVLTSKGLNFIKTTPK